METMPAGPGPLPDAKLVFLSGPLRGSVLAIEKPRVSIGRDPRNDISLQDGVVSNFHAAIVRDADGRFWIEDLDSMNGTFVGGNRIVREALRDGNVLTLSRTGVEIQFILGEPTLPSILESTTATFVRTRSIGRALTGLLPQGRRSAEVLSLSGVRKLLDYRLEETAHRQRTLLAIIAAGILITLACLGSGLIYLSGRSATPSGAASGPGSPAGLPLTAAPAGIRVVPSLRPVYGSLFLSYREDPIGEVEVTNDSDLPLSGCEIRFRFEPPHATFLVEPWAVPLPEVAPHSTARIPITPKLSTEILVDQTLEVTAGVALTRDGLVLLEASRAIFIHDRHILSWERPERIAAFIDPNDPVLAAFLRAVWTFRPASGQNEIPTTNIISALTILTALGEMGLTYMPDPANPVSERVDWTANDRVNYPGETLLARAGDCDDLSVLCCALLHAVRVPATLVLGPGHVFFIFDSGIRGENLARTPFDPSMVVIWKGRVWIPVEATNLIRPGSGFASAWAAAAPQAARIATGEMRTIDLAEAWRKYQPMNPAPDPVARRRIIDAVWAREGLPGRVASALAGLRESFRRNLDRRVEEVAKVQEAGPARDLAVGLLYARSGLFDDARRIFEASLFVDKAPRDAAGLDQWKKPVTEEVSVLLSNLAVCITQCARAADVLGLAAACQRLAVQGVPDGDELEKGKVMLRLALIHRLRGDLAAERSACDGAFRIEPTLEAVYKDLVATGGPVSGPEERVLQFLREGLRG